MKRAGDHRQPDWRVGYPGRGPAKNHRFEYMRLHNIEPLSSQQLRESQNAEGQFDNRIRRRGVRIKVSHVERNICRAKRVYQWTLISRDDSGNFESMFVAELTKLLVH